MSSEDKSVSLQHPDAQEHHVRLHHISRYFEGYILAYISLQPSSHPIETEPEKQRKSPAIVGPQTDAAFPSGQKRSFTQPRPKWLAKHYITSVMPTQDPSKPYSLQPQTTELPHCNDDSEEGLQFHVEKQLSATAPA